MYQVQNTKALSFTLKYRNIIWITLFIISMINNVSLMVASVIFVLCFCARYKEEGAVESLLFIQFRSLINTGIAESFSGSSAYVKWGLIFLISLYIFILPMQKELRKLLGNIYMAFTGFSLFCVFSAWMNSSYPLAAMFKIVAYVVPFLAILKGICSCYNVDWRKKIIWPLGIILFGGLLFINSEVGYLRNGYAFQGAINHPNVMGIMCALFLGVFVYKKNVLNLRDLIILDAMFYMIYLSGSRTAFFSGLMLIMLYVLKKNVKPVFRMLMIIGLIILAVLIVLNESNLLIDFIFKGHADDLLYSRTNQISNNLSRFCEHPFGGTGLNVPYDSDIRTMEFTLDLTTENGNLILALLGDLGVIGTILFGLCYMLIFVKGEKGLNILFIIPFLVCMGEMSFFSTNNFGIILYVLFGVYLSESIMKKYTMRVLDSNENNKY